MQNDLIFRMANEWNEAIHTATYKHYQSAAPLLFLKQSLNKQLFKRFDFMAINAFSRKQINEK